MFKGKIGKYTFILLLLSTIYSCTKTEDNNASPSAGDARDKLVGTWKADETSKLGGKATYNVTISKDATSADGILIKNLYELTNASTIASFDGASITIPQQSVSGYTIKGSGTFTSTINLNFTTNDGQKTDSVTVICHH
jgi:hypothetical protein